MKQSEERVRTLEQRNVQESEVAGQREEARGDEAGGKEETEKLRERLRELEIRMEVEERMKRKRNIIIKGVKLGYGTGEEEVKNLMRDIGAQVRVEEVRNLAGQKGRKRQHSISENREQAREERGFGEEQEHKKKKTGKRREKSESGVLECFRAKK